MTSNPRPLAKILEPARGRFVVWCRLCGELDGEDGAQAAAHKLGEHIRRHTTEPL